MKETINNWRFVILLSLTLGLAPFVPEPHIWGKIKWIAGGAMGMAALDWFDFVFHGIPWVLLIRLSIIKLAEKFKKPALDGEESGISNKSLEEILNQAKGDLKKKDELFF